MFARVSFVRLAAVATAGFLLSGLVRAECGSSQTSKPSSSRYVVKGATVYDKKTDLTWSRCSQGQEWKDELGCVGVVKTFAFAWANAEQLNGWRLPTVEELKTLIAKNCRNPAIDEEMFPDTLSEYYHTSSNRDSHCWLVHFGSGDLYDGYTYSYQRCDGTYAVRLVRPGQ